ncbi:MULTISPECIES: HdeD family acid-resistance protein [unclassified Nocardioides]|uniref:HdeD family acid-resistance protein n=1 Tax=unclassified Nocardioides TaxID=2615069 RepID=UPI0036199814
MGEHTATSYDDRSREVPPVLRGLAEHWGLVLAYGVVTLGLGVILIVWPDATITVFTVLLAIQLIVAGIFRIVAALQMHRSEGMRALVGLTGGIALIVGLLILRDPLQSVLVLGMILGVFWLIVGIVDILGAIVAPPPEGRGWPLFNGVLGVALGGFLVVYTDLSLRVLVVLVAIWLIVAGALALVAAFQLRSMRATS